MRQLTGLDTTFLRIESPTTYGHVSGLTLFDPSSRASEELTLEDVREHIRERLHLLPPVSLAPRGGAVLARQPVLGRVARVRPRFPRARAGAARPGRRSPAGRAGGPARRPPARSLAPAVGAVRDPRHRGRPRRPAHQDAPRGGRRRVRSRDHGDAARHHARAPPGAAAAEGLEARDRARRAEHAGPRDRERRDQAASDPALGAEHPAEPGGRAGHGQPSRGRHALEALGPGGRARRGRAAGATQAEGAREPR